MEENIKAAVQDLFNLYLGRGTNSRQSVHKPAKRVFSGTQKQPPKDEQFQSDFLRLQSQFPPTEYNQLQTITESFLVKLLVQCGSHALQAEFLLFALRTLTRIGTVRWDMFLMSLFRAVFAVESSSMVGATPTSPPGAMIVDTAGMLPSAGRRALPWLRSLVCKVMTAALEADLKPVSCFDMLCQTVQWINDMGQGGSEAENYSSGNAELESLLVGCLEVLRALVEESKCRAPYYALFHEPSQLQVDYWPENEALLGFFLDVHRRRDRIALLVTMLDSHLHCPTFATLRTSVLTYTGVIGEALSGEDVAASVQKGSLEWEKALRCLRHGLRANPSADIWRRLFLCAPRHHQQQQGTQPRSGPNTSWTQQGVVFNSEMTCEAVVERIMNLMQPLNPGSSSLTVSTTENGRWQEWLIFADLFYYLMRRGFLDFLEFVDKLATAIASGGYPIVRSNHVTWLLAQVFRLDSVTQALSVDPKKVDTVQKILSFHMVDRPTDQGSAITPQAMLLDFVGSSQILRLWALNRAVMEHLIGNRMPEHIQKGKAIDEWWKKAERTLDYSNLDEKSMGMVWVLSHTMTQPVCEAIMAWMRSNGTVDIVGSGQGERLTVVHETRLLSITMLSGLSLHLCMRLNNHVEDQIFTGQIVPSIAMLECYVRLLLVAPQTLFQHHVTGMMQKYQPGSGKIGISLILLELLNYRLIPLYRFHGKLKQLVFDISKIIVPMKSKRGDHRLFRLAENLEMNLILSMKEVLLMRRDKGANTEFTETLNRVMIMSLAITMKTRGITESEQLLVLPTAIEQILATSTHIWSPKTMRHFPPLLRQFLASRPDKRLQTLHTWQQVEPTILPQCQQLLSSLTTADVSVLNHVFQHRHFIPFFCAGAWVVMDCHPEKYNIQNLGKLLKELSPEEVTANVYALVDVILHHIQVQLQRQLYTQQDLLLRASATLAYLIWTQALLPFDTVLLALIDRDDDIHSLRLVVGLLQDRTEFKQRVQQYHQHHKLDQPGPFQRPDVQQALGSHLAGKDRFPVSFDDMCLRALPVIQLVIYRLIENDAQETAERVLSTYVPLLYYHPLRFTFVRDILAYFHSFLAPMLIRRLLSILDKTQYFSDAFVRILNTTPPTTPPYEYYVNFLLGLVNTVIPPLSNQNTAGENIPRVATKGATDPSENCKSFYHHQDPGSSTQLLLEISVIELLSLPSVKPSEIVETLVQIAVRVPTPPAPLTTNSTPTSPSAVSSDSLAASAAPSVSPFLSPQIIQAFALVLTQLPPAFHEAYYEQVQRTILDCWWLKDFNKSSKEMEAAFGYSAWDPTWAVQDGTSTVLGNTVALFHAFAANLPFEWLESTHAVINLQKPIISVAQLRLAFRMIGPLVPRFVVSRPIFAKTLKLLFAMLAEVFGRNALAQDVSEISDLIDFVHHAVMLEAQQVGGKPRIETLSLCSKCVEVLHPDAQHLFQHLTAEHQTSIYAATHPKIVPRPASFFGA